MAENSVQERVEAGKLPTLYAFFSAGGVLANSSLPYEYRPGQLEMARAVERALEEKRHLIVEAGTGTGKTLAYLLPALRDALETGRRISFSFAMCRFWRACWGR